MTQLSLIIENKLSSTANIRLKLQVKDGTDQTRRPTLTFLMKSAEAKDR